MASLLRSVGARSIRQVSSHARGRQLLRMMSTEAMPLQKPRDVEERRWPSSLAKDAYTHLKDRSYLTQQFDYMPEKDRKKVLYEVTLEVDEDIVEDYLDWIRSGHIQEALALPGFKSWSIASLEGDAKTRGKNGQRRVVLVENYEMESREALETYFQKYAQPIRDDHTRMWDGKFAASRRILTLFGKQDEKETQLWKDREKRNSFRLRNLKEQVKKVQYFTEGGFRLGKTPAPLWDKIQAFYNENKHKAVREHINPIEVSINTWAAPTYKLEYPPELGDEILATFKPILEEWSGIPDLEPVGISGIRTYQSGATIAEHVDMADTNVISALINIDQNVEEPWPFEMRDHSGKMHAMDMVPGDAIIYESATCAHRRFNPLKGMYANTFMRFRPRGWTYNYTYDS